MCDFGCSQNVIGISLEIIICLRALDYFIHFLVHLKKMKPLCLVIVTGLEGLVSHTGAFFLAFIRKYHELLESHLKLSFL